MMISEQTRSTTEFTHNPTLATAKFYASLGWAIFPVVYGDKHPYTPFVPNGIKNATTDISTIEMWFGGEKMFNIGVACGESSNLVVVDIDVGLDKHGNPKGGDAFFETYEYEFGDTPKAITGSGGTHIFYQYNALIKNKAPIHKGVDIQSDGSYVVLDPSKHTSGNFYRWQDDYDPFETALAQAPQWLVDLCVNAAPVVSSAFNFDAAQADAVLPFDVVQDVRGALSYVNCDDYHEWVKVGMALKETGAGQQAFAIWDEWSKRSHKYDSAGMLKKWESFKRSDVTLNSVFAIAGAKGYVALTIPVSIESVNVATQESEELPHVPEHLMTIPNVLGDAVAWINHNARKPQPLLAVQAALAYGATVCGRRYVTAGGIVPSLYMLNIAESGAGKEDSRRAVERLLDASGLEHLIGNSGYSSSAGVLSALIEKPSHFTAIDEFGMMLEQAKNTSNNNGASVISQIMSVYGTMNDVLRPLGYSTNGMTQAQKESMAKRKVVKPALSLVGLTTPESFFKAVGSAGVKNGFLNRFITVISEQGFQPTQFKQSTPAPFSVLAAAQDVVNVSTGNLQAIDAPHDLEPNLTVIDVADDVYAAYGDYELEVASRITQLKNDGLHEMINRLPEQAMRIALILVAFDKATTITLAHYTWARDYVDVHAQRMIHSIKGLVSDSDNEAIQKAVVAHLTKAGAQGVSMKVLINRVKRFAALGDNASRRMEFWIKAGIIAAITTETGAVRYVALADNDE